MRRAHRVLPKTSPGRCAGPRGRFHSSTARGGSEDSHILLGLLNQEPKELGYLLGNAFVLLTEASQEEYERKSFSRTYGSWASCIDRKKKKFA